MAGIRERLIRDSSTLTKICKQKFFDFLTYKDVEVIHHADGVRVNLDLLSDELVHQLWAEMTILQQNPIYEQIPIHEEVIYTRATRTPKSKTKKEYKRPEPIIKKKWEPVLIEREARDPAQDKLVFDAINKLAKVVHRDRVKLYVK